MHNHYTYPGDELSLFKEATTWKNYLKENIKPYIQGDVLEVGAALGGTTKILNDGSCRSWTLLEPDEKMARDLEKNKQDFPANTFIIHGTIQSTIPASFDTILYIDVLEHIENDIAELSLAVNKLRPDGHLIVLSPAFQFLYTKFDAAIGHYKRYHCNDIKKLTLKSARLEVLQYLDSAGFFASLMNKFFLHQTYPTQKQIRFWDKTLVPVSKITDKLFFHSFGKAILAIWKKNEA